MGIVPSLSGSLQNGFAQALLQQVLLHMAILSITCLCVCFGVLVSALCLLVRVPIVGLVFRLILHLLVAVLAVVSCALVL